MKPSLLTMPCALLAAVLVTPLAAQIEAAPIYADTIYTGGDIVTVNELQPTTEAVAVRGGRIVAVGYSDACFKMASHVLVDAGVIDVHLHGIDQD